MQALRPFVEQFIDTYRPLYIDMARAQWDLAVSASEVNEQRYGAALNALRRLLSDADLHAELSRLIAVEQHVDAVLMRQAKLLLAEMTANQGPASLLTAISTLEVQVQGVLARFRATVGGRVYQDNDVKTVLRASTDAALRQQVWCASKSLGEQSAPLIIELAQKRNQLARGLGFRDYYGMSLVLAEIDEAEMFAAFDALDVALAPSWQTFKRSLDAQYASRFGCATSDLRPWHYEDPFFQEAPEGDVNLDGHFAGRNVVEIAARYFDSIGLNIDDVLARSDLYEREGKDPHAFCTNIDRNGDVRTLNNVRNTARWMETMLHELGHAAYEKFVDPALPWLLRTCSHLMTTEGIAIFMGNLTLDDIWLANHAGMPVADATRAARELKRTSARQNLVFAKWVFVMSHFERALYADPAQDLNRLWWQVVERFQGLQAPGREQMPDWASKVHFGIAPVYYHNYLLGSMVAGQLAGHVAANELSRQQLGATLISRCFRTGALLDWRAWVIEATGRPLDGTAYAASIASAL